MRSESTPKSEGETAHLLGEPAGKRPVPLWLCLLLPALGGWLGWGIRGQFGHECGAYVAGALIALSVALCSRHPQVRQRALLIGAAGGIAIGYGGLITYGQTNGLLNNDDLNWRENYWWGYLGLAVKSGMWFGLGATFMGMAAGFKKYRPWEVFWVTAGMTGLFYIGYLLINKPFDPAHLRLPAIYFSDFVNIGKPDWKPRQEYWGGLWFGLIGLVAYLALIKRDAFATRVSLWGILGGAVAMPNTQAINAWASHQAAAGHPVLPWINWWSVFETSCGFVGGLIIAIGWIISERGRTPLSQDEFRTELSPGSKTALGLVALASLAVFLIYPTWRGSWSDLEPTGLALVIARLSHPSWAGAWAIQVMEQPELMIPFITAGVWIAFAFTGQFGQWAVLLSVLGVTAAQNITDHWGETQWGGHSLFAGSWPRPAAWALAAIFLIIAWALSRKERGGARLAASALTAVAFIQTAMSVVKSWVNETTLSTWGFLPPKPADPSQCQGIYLSTVNEFAYICAALALAWLGWWAACRIVAAGGDAQQHPEASA